MLGQPNLHTPPPTRRPVLWESPDTTTGAFWATLERSGSLRNDIQTENLKNGHFWSLQLGSGRHLAAARARFSFSARIMLWCSFWINLGPQNGSQLFMMATLGPPLLNLNPYWERLSVRSMGSCAKSRHRWPQTCSKSYAQQLVAAFGALTWASSS